MNRARWAVALLLCAATAGASRALQRSVPPAALDVPVRSVAATVGTWQGVDQEITERQYRLLETREVLFRDYRDEAGREVLACVVVAEGNQKAAHPPEICYRGQGWTIVEADSPTLEVGRVRRVLRLRVEWRGQEELVYAWYRIGAHETTSVWSLHGRGLLARVQGRSPISALVRLSTPVREGDARAAHRALADFAAVFLPELEVVLSSAGR